jgi:hypothetical protein
LFTFKRLLPKDCKMKAVGAPSSRSKEEQDKVNTIKNPINNPIYNPISSKKRKEVNDLESRKIIDDQGLGHIMRSKTETEELCEHLLSVKMYAILGGLTWSESLAHLRPSFCSPCGCIAA